MENDFVESDFISWEKLTLSNDFLFFKVMQDKELLLELIRRILNDVKVEDIRVHAQKQVEQGLDVHGVRFDIFVRDMSGRIITVEMHVTDRRDLPLRTRFYSSMSDMDALDKGGHYGELPESYVIFICMFDYFKQGLHRYTFKRCCVEKPEVEFGDKSTYIVLNARSTDDDVDDRLKSFLDYLDGRMSDDEYILKLDKAVRRSKMNKEWSRDYMVAHQRDLEHEAIGEERGLAIGKEQGLAIGEERGFNIGQEQLANAIEGLRNGESVQALMESGISEDTVNLARRFA